MADSLDDFFAKKDKKRKNKSQTAALSAGSLVRELEVGSKQSEYAARRDGKTSAAMELLGLNANDGEWKDFEEAEKRDYTGLKVKEMSIQDQDDEQRRLIEQSDQVPETIPWKSKEDTVAALISAKSELNQLDEDPIKEEQESSTDTTPAAEATTTPTPTATISNDTTDSSSLSKTDNTDSDASKAAPSSTQPDDKQPEAAATAIGEPKEGEKSATSGSNVEAPKKDGDSQPAASVKKAYVPPHERFEKENKVLEPIRLSRLKTTSSRPGARIDIGNQQEFPGLG